MYAIGLWSVGLDLGLLIGFIAGIVSFVPYLGPATGVVMGVVAAMVQFGDWKHVALVLGVFGIGQVIESYVLTPRLVGNRIGLHPVAVIFAIMAGGQLFGFLGVLLALPIAAVVNVLLRYAHERYTRSRLYAGDAPPGLELDAYAGERDDEVALFDFHNRARSAGIGVLYTATVSPDALPLALPDLRSRLQQCARIMLAPLDDAGRRDVLRDRAQRRGLMLEDA